MKCDFILQDDLKIDYNKDMSNDFVSGHYSYWKSYDLANFIFQRILNIE